MTTSAKHRHPGTHHSPRTLLDRLFDVIGPFFDMTLEQFEINLMRDTHPEDEVAVWCSITAAWIAYHEQHLDNEYLPDEDEK